MNQYYFLSVKYALLAIACFGLLTCSWIDPPRGIPQKPEPYTITKIKELPPTNVALNLQHHFEIELSDDVKTAEIELPLQREHLRGIDINTLHLIRVDTETEESHVVGPLKFIEQDIASATVSESGFYTIAGIPIDYRSWVGLIDFCDRMVLNPLRAGPLFDRICLVINCPGDFESPSLCDQCFGGGVPFVECSIPRFPLPPPSAARCPAVPANGISKDPAVSSNGRYVVFSSVATNLIAEDRNGFQDIFLRDRETCTTELISVDSAENQGNAPSYVGGGPVISDDGRFVVFTSEASNLVAGDTRNGDYDHDVFVRDRELGITELVSINSAGEQANGKCAFLSTSHRFTSMSADGRYVLFSSTATNLVEDTFGTGLFLHDRTGGITERVDFSPYLSRPERGGWGGVLSADARYIAFYASDERPPPGVPGSGFDVFVYDRITGTTTLISADPDGNASRGDVWPSISGDGNWVVFNGFAPSLVPPDTNDKSDTYVANRITGVLRRVSNNNLDDPSTGGATVYQPVQMMEPFWWWEPPRLNHNGQFVVFTSHATDLFARDTNSSLDVFRRNLVSNELELVSKDSSGTLGNDDSHQPQIDSSGHMVAFSSEASNLVPIDYNGVEDVFLRDMRTDEVELISTGYVEP